MTRNGCVRSSLSILFAATLVAGAGDRPAAKDGFLDQVRVNFAAWDADHDGVLSADEVERALDDPAVTGPAAAAAATLRRSMYAYDLGPITVDRLAAIVDAPAATVPKPPPPLAATYAAALKKIDRTPRAVFVSGRPRVETLGQGRLGDCFLLAAVGTMAASQPDRLGAMVDERSDGQVSVHFGDGRTVTLPRPTDGEVVIGSGTLGDGVWGNVFEKAIGRVLLDRQRMAKYVTPYQIIGVGGSPHVPLGILTGHGYKRVECDDFQKPGKLTAAARAARLDAARDELVAAFTAGKLVVGGTGGTRGGGAKVPGLYFDHSYGVLGYDRKSDLVTFWNPMRNHFAPAGPAGLVNGYATAHGRFDCPLTDAVMWFGSVSIETDEPDAK